MTPFQLLIIFGLFLQIFSSVFGAENENAYFVKLHLDPASQKCTILAEESNAKFRGFKSDNLGEIWISSKNAQEPTFDANLDIKDKSQILEIFSREKTTVTEHIKSICKEKETLPLLTKGEMDDMSPDVVKLVDGGARVNRIDVVFMGDGYTKEEKPKFFSDMRRLVGEMFNGVTFKSYLPLFNIWAIYVESKESGIGHSEPKNTPFGLYREKGQLRGIFPANAKYARRVCLLTGSSGCDYPSLIGNDDFYGGLGGEFVISTKSHRTGTIVLRHEMGHNFVKCGEEYDNGFVYSGPNSAKSLDQIGWRHWLTNPGPPKEEKSTYRILDYPWVNLNEGAKTYIFSSSGNYEKTYCIVSVSAAGEEDSLQFEMDGEVLPWKSTGSDDREFYDWSSPKGFSLGFHNFTVWSKTSNKHPTVDRMLCSVSCHEFDESYIEDNEHISAYPTWDFLRRKTYRPTNGGCLMRNMTHEHLCPVCKEGMWLQFFRRISIIDDIEIINRHEDGSATVRLNTLKLGQLRPESQRMEGERLQVRWFHERIEKKSVENKFEINAVPGNWNVRVKFETPEVRSDPEELLKDSTSFQV